LSDEELVVIVELGSERRALLVRQLSFHQVAEGTLGGEPFVATFCSTCHAGIGFTPVVEGKRFGFSCGGIYDGMPLLIDDETRSYWRHLSGRAIYGKLAGTQLDAWPLLLTTKKAALSKYPGLTISLSKPSLFGKLVGALATRSIKSRGMLPPMYAPTLGEVDPRLFKFEEGLGVVLGDQARFYPRKALGSGADDAFAGRTLRVGLDPEDGIPRARLTDDGSIPLQLFVRWYAFSFTWPSCDVYQG
jgi:hypothetical protein